jgi:glycosyltransferase involved in cell wall biosynthesis
MPEPAPNNDRDRALTAERLRLMTAEIVALRAELTRQSTAHDSRLRKVEADLKKLRLDRQLKRLPRGAARFAKRRLKRLLRLRASGRSGSGVASPGLRSGLFVVAHSYPSDETTYGGQPIARRVAKYRQQGNTVTVFIPSRDASRSETVDRDGSTIVTAPIAALGDVFGASGAGSIAVHSPTPEIWPAVAPLTNSTPTFVWFHGFESRDWRDLIFNFSDEEIEELGPQLDAVNIHRRKMLLPIFANDAIGKIFVSRHQQHVAETFVGAVATNSEVIHNLIDPDQFFSRPRVAEDRFKIAIIRSFSKRNYGTDLAVQALMLLVDEPWFPELQVRIIGDGRHHEEDVAPIRDFANVSIEPGFLGQADLRSVLANTGIALLPTRWDSQGMMMGESMAAGVVPVTNAVTAIPEFIDDSCAMLAANEDISGLADGIRAVINDPEGFLQMSHHARERVTAQCGPSATTSRELELLSK